MRLVRTPAKSSPKQQGPVATNIVAARPQPPTTATANNFLHTKTRNKHSAPQARVSRTRVLRCMHAHATMCCGARSPATWACARKQRRAEHTDTKPGRQYHTTHRTLAGLEVRVYCYPSPLGNGRHPAGKPADCRPKCPTRRRYITQTRPNYTPTRASTRGIGMARWGTYLCTMLADETRNRGGADQRILPLFATSANREARCRPWSQAHHHHMHVLW